MIFILRKCCQNVVYQICYDLYSSAGLKLSLFTGVLWVHNGDLWPGLFVHKSSSFEQKSMKNVHYQNGMMWFKRLALDDRFLVSITEVCNLYLCGTFLANPSSFISRLH